MSASSRHLLTSIMSTRFSSSLSLLRFGAFAVVGTASVALLAACSHRAAETDAHAEHAASAGTPATTRVADVAAIPASATTVAERIAKSPRHGEYAMIRTGPSDSVRAWIVYPERSSKAPVVVVVHEIFGLSAWVRGVADQLAADGFIAIAPDLLTGKVPLVPGTDTVVAQAATAAIRSLSSDVVQRQLAAVGQYGMSLPAAEKRYGVVGFCWGGSASFQSAVMSPAGQGAAVVYYGTSPATSSLASVKVPVLGLYGGEDARVGATVPPADSAMKALGKRFEPHTFAGAGHGFLRQQEGQNGANLAAARQAWPMTIAFFRSTLGR
jgi:carboxymethylenebutenolidase